MAAAALRIAGILDGQGRIWGHLAFGRVQKGTDDPIEGTVRDMVLIGDQVQGYDMTRHHIKLLHAQDAYDVDDVVTPNPVIPVEAGNRRPRSTEDIVARVSDSHEADIDKRESSFCDCGRSKR